tara:strand:- start:230 stop:553 length:324 start_codon:yes stop_codon:yes gene_type:complete
VDLPILFAVTYTLAGSFSLLLLCYLLHVRWDFGESQLLTRCTHALFGVFITSALLLIQFIAIDIGGVVGFFVHVYGLVVPTMVLSQEFQEKDGTTLQKVQIKKPSLK